MKYHHYSHEQIEFLTELTKEGYTTVETAEIYNELYPDDPINRNCVQSFRANHHVHSPNTGRYEKGHVPFNKGKHIKTTGRMAETQFKKGHIPKNHKPVGYISIRHDKCRKDYQYIKVAEPNKWKMLHVKVWEDHNGAVPDGYMVTFVDGDTMNCDIDNLILISRQQNLVRNQYGLEAYDQDSAEVMKNIIGLRIKIGSKRQELRRQKKRV